MIGPRHSFESVVRELREGLQDGSVTLTLRHKAKRKLVHVLPGGFDKIIKEIRSRLAAEGMLKGHRAKDEFWRGFRREVFSSIDVMTAFPLRAKTVITIHDRLYFRGVLIDQQTRSITLDREVQSATEFTTYVKSLVPRLSAPIVTYVQMESGE
jgi:hypothetical protein